MTQLFINKDQKHGDRIFISGTDYHHLIRVLRSSLGDHISATDNKGYCYQSVIEEIKKDQLVCKISQRKKVCKIIPQVTLAQSLIKKDKIEWVLQKATELNVAEIIPLQTSRTVVNFDQNTFKRTQRWNSIIKTAAQQSERMFLPELSAPTSIDKLPIENYDLTIMCLARKERPLLINCLASNIKYSKILCIIGPEGGFTLDEENSILNRGGTVVSLGPSILRSETAAIACLSQLQMLFKRNK